MKIFRSALLALISAALLLGPVAAMASDLETSNWSETAGSNNATPPNGWPEGMAPSTVNDAARENMAALKRDWNRTHTTISSTGSANAYVLTYTTAPASLVNGQQFAFKASFANTGAATANVNSLGAISIVKQTTAGQVALAANDIVSTQHVILEYDSATTKFILLNPQAGSLAAATTTQTITGTATDVAVTPDSLAALWERAADVTDGATINLGDGGSFNLITSTTAITAFTFTTSKSGRIAKVRFNTARTLTHNGTSLILPGAANITTAAGDIAEVEDLGSGNVRVNWYTRAAGTPIIAPTGSVVQVVNTQTGSMTTGATTIPYDDTIPQITEGNEFMTLAITPTSTSNKLKIDVVFNGSVANASNRIIVALFQDSTPNALATAMQELSATTQVGNVKFTYYMTAGTTSSTTFRVRAGGSVGTITFNGTNGVSLFNGTSSSSITITEIKA